MGDLVVIDPLVIALLALGSAASCAGGWLLLHRRHHAAGLATAALALLFSLTTAGDVVNAHFAYLPRLADVVGQPSWPIVKQADLRQHTTAVGRRPSKGGVLVLSVPGRRSGFSTHPAMVYLPAQYFTEPKRRFPVLYLLHGSPGTPVDWFRADRASDAGLAAAQSGHPLILVAPTMSRRWSDDSECVNSPRERIEAYLTADVIPQIDDTFRTLTSRTSRAVAGNSAGGYCALNLGLRHRDVFSTIIDLSGYTHPTYDAGLAALFGRGPGLLPRVAANTPADYASHLTLEPKVRIWLDSGQADRRPRRELAAVAPTLRSRGQEVVLRLRSGAHTHNVWRPALRQAVLWAAPALTPSMPADSR